MRFEAFDICVVVDEAGAAEDAVPQHSWHQKELVGLELCPAAHRGARDAEEDAGFGVVVRAAEGAEGANADHSDCGGEPRQLLRILIAVVVGVAFGDVRIF